MKRDLDLIREILFVVEQHPVLDRTLSLQGKQFADKFPGITDDILNEHIQLSVEANLLEAEPYQLGWFITRLTGSGHDFLDNSRVKSVWEKTKHVAGQLSFGVFAATLNEAATTYAKQAISGG